MILDRRSLLLAGAATAFAVTAQSAAGASGEAAPMEFGAWRAGFIDRAAASFGRERVERELADLTPDPRVVALDGASRS